MNDTPTTIVIGAGLTGLTAAFYLKKAGHTCLLLEQSDRVGGQIKTYEENGFIFESGPNTGVVGNAEVAELFEDLAPLCALEIANPAAKRRLIWKGDRFHVLPSGLLSGLTTPLFAFSDKFRLLLEPFRAKGTDPHESVGALAARRMGLSFLDYAVDPFLSGVYAGDPLQLVTRFALPKLYQLEQDYGSFIKGALAKAKQPKTARDKKATKDVFSVANGLEGLPKALAKAIGSEAIALGVKDIQITPDAEQYTVHYTQKGVVKTVQAKQIITTVPAYALADLLDFVDPKSLSAITSLTYAPVVQVSAGFKHLPIHLLPAFGGLVPSKENRQVLGILYPYACFQNRAPQGGALFSFFMGGMRHKDLLEASDEAIRELIYADLEAMLQLPAGVKPDLLRIFRHSRAIPQYEQSSEQRFEAITSIEQRYPHLYLGGNMHQGIGMADRIKQGRLLAQRAIESV